MKRDYCEGLRFERDYDGRAFDVINPELKGATVGLVSFYWHNGKKRRYARVHIGPNVRDYDAGRFEPSFDLFCRNSMTLETAKELWQEANELEREGWTGKTMRF